MTSSPTVLIIILTSFWGSYVCANFGDYRPRNATVRVPTDWPTDTLTHANRFYNLFHAICYSYGTDNVWLSSSWSFATFDNLELKCVWLLGCAQNQTSSCSKRGHEGEGRGSERERGKASIKRDLCFSTIWNIICCSSKSLFITETIYCTSFYLGDVTVRMICQTGLLTENWFRKKLLRECFISLSFHTMLSSDFH